MSDKGINIINYYESMLCKLLYFDKHSLTEEHQLGCGGYGKVYSGHYLKTKLAIKKTKKPTNEEFMKEIFIISKYKHPNIPRFIGITEDKKSKISLLLEKIEGETLETMLNRIYSKRGEEKLHTISKDNLAENRAQYTKQHKSFIENNSNSQVSLQEQVDDDPAAHHPINTSRNVQFLLCFLDISSILVFLHGVNLIHRDIKPTNLMFENNGNCKLLDFGISKKANHTETITETGGTIIYMAPENFISYTSDTDTYTTRSKVSTKVDIWAFGCLLSQTYSGEKPWIGQGTIDNRTVFAKLFKGHKFPIPPIISKTSKEMADLISRCCENNQEKRICSGILKYYLMNIMFLTVSENMKNGGFCLNQMLEKSKTIKSKTSTLF